MRWCEAIGGSRFIGMSMVPAGDSMIACSRNICPSKTGTPSIWSVTPEWERIFEAIGEMNGKEHTLICLEGEMKMHLTIGGVPEVFVVYASGDEEIFFTAIDPAKAGDMWRWPSASS